MLKYIVYITPEYSLTVEAVDFEVKYDRKMVRFHNGDRNTAFFNLDNIIGFEQVDKPTVIDAEE